MATYKTYYKNPVLVGAGTYKYRPYTVLTATVALNLNLTGCSTTQTHMNRFGQTTITFTKETDYNWPTTVQVTGATLVSWNSGTLVVEKATSDSVTITVTCTEVVPQEYTDCLTFTGKESEFTLKATYKTWDGTLEWSTDHEAWTTLAGTEAMQSVDKKLYLRGKNTTFYDGANKKGVQWQLSGKADCSGNIQTLLDWENPPTGISTVSCYSSMFNQCTNLTTAPELPATTLASSCYSSMFRLCRSLTTAPELPATTLADDCYSSMFYACGLTTTPELPATTLADDCYKQMFYNCAHLTIAPELPATTLTDYCYKQMFENCKSLTTAPELPATTLVYACYSSMFAGCDSLTTAPELPATTLVTDCYDNMFYSCITLKVNTTSGNKIFTCPSTIPTRAVENMFVNTGGEFTGTPVADNTYYYTV